MNDNYTKENTRTWALGTMPQTPLIGLGFLTSDLTSGKA